MKKKTYTLDTQEQELGAVIDQSINPIAPATEHKEAPTSSAPMVSTSPLPVSVVSGSPADTTSPPKKIMKNIWVPPTIDSKVKVIRAYRKAQGMDATFDAVANEAIREYVENHLREAMEWGMA